MIGLVFIKVGLTERLDDTNDGSSWEPVFWSWPSKDSADGTAHRHRDDAGFDDPFFRRRMHMF